MQFLATRPLRRLLVTTTLLGIVVLLSILLEPRRRSFSCRSIWSCTNPYQRQSEYQISTVLEEQQISVTETTLADGTVRFHRKLKAESVPSILFLVLTRDGHAWSRDYQSTRRSIYDFLDLLANTRLDPQGVALGLLTESKAEYGLLKKATDEIPLGRVTILLKNATERGVGAGFKAGLGDANTSNGKGGIVAQAEWKGSMARQRNYLTMRVLLDEKHVVWVDAGVVEFSPGIIQEMIGHSETRSDVGIITARCSRDKISDYDTSAWAISTTSPLFDIHNTQMSDNTQSPVGELEKSRRPVHELITGTLDSDIVPLHSVGGSLLYIRADLIRQGLLFPWWRVIGTQWSQDGWTAIDSEGLCYMSSQLRSGGCFLLGGTHYVRHTDWG